MRPPRHRHAATRATLLAMAVALSPPVAMAVDRLVLSEVMYDPSGPDDQLEWIEFFNGYSTPVELCGYTLAVAGTSYLDGTQAFDALVPSGAYFVVGGPGSTADNGNPTYDLVVDLDPGPQNSGTTADAVAIFDTLVVVANQIPTDAVLYGTDNLNGLLDEEGGMAVDVPDAPSGNSLERSGDRRLRDCEFSCWTPRSCSRRFRSSAERS